MTNNAVFRVRLTYEAKCKLENLPKQDGLFKSDESGATYLFNPSLLNKEDTLLTIDEIIRFVQSGLELTITEVKILGE